MKTTEKLSKMYNTPIRRSACYARLCTGLPYNRWNKEAADIQRAFLQRYEALFPAAYKKLVSN